MKHKWIFILGGIGLVVAILLIVLVGVIAPSSGATDIIADRKSLIPEDAIKMSAKDDPTPPLSLSDEFEQPVALPHPVNTAGMEDSAFILPDGETLYLWFTPNNRMDAAEQARDGATGIYQFNKLENGWSEGERIWLVEPGTPHLDGCGFFQDDKVWVCGIREGVDGMHWFTSKYQADSWAVAELADFEPDYEVGELHISKDGRYLYFHSRRAGGMGGLDIWVSQMENGEWQEPENLTALNSVRDEGWPALNPAEDELWITRNYGLWRSRRVDGEWQVAELMVSPLAGEASIDAQGNVYFTHHYYVEGEFIETDIYRAKRK